MGLADILGNIGDKVGQGAGKLSDIFNNQGLSEQLQQAVQGMPQAGNVLQQTIDNTVQGTPQAPNVIQGAIDTQAQAEQAQRPEWQNGLLDASKKFADSQYTAPQQYKIGALPQMQYAPNKQYNGLTGFLKQVRGY